MAAVLQVAAGPPPWSAVSHAHCQFAPVAQRVTHGNEMSWECFKADRPQSAMTYLKARISAADIRNIQSIYYRLVTGLANSTAMVARSSRDAARALTQERSCDPCTKAHATLGDRPGRRIDHLTARTQEGRDALRAPQTHPPARPAAITRPHWSPRRVLPRSSSPKPPQNGQDHPNVAAPHGLKKSAAARRFRPHSVKCRIYQQYRSLTPNFAPALSVEVLCRRSNVTLAE